ncbi:MAG: diacylglycerol kinase family lipid kinase [Acidobacteriia bacterium]|nr:diacylglycerol kinase family lipid kinase [Terriglobia bacterium]
MAFARESQRSAQDDKGVSACYSLPDMRAAVIFGLGSYEKDLKPFQEDSRDTWLIGLPASASEADAILIFGGDGTVHRHLAQLVKLQLPVLVVPCGSGNDFARALGLRKTNDSLAAWKKFASEGSNVRTIDLGIIKPQRLKPSELGGSDRSAEALRHPIPSPSPTQHYFCCVGGVGLDGEVARRANQLPRWLRGHGGYVVSLPPALFRFVPLRMKISIPGDEDSSSFVVRSEQPTILAVFANTSTYGGGMKIAPRARMDDGQLDVCLIRDLNKLKLFCLFPTIYFGGHLRMPEVEYFQAERLWIETERPLDVYADGEYVCKTPIDVQVARDALRVIVHPSHTSF